MGPVSGPSLPRHHQDRLKILAFGNSLTEGYTDFGMRFHPYGNALEERLSGLVPEVKSSVDVEGRSGDCVLSSLGGNSQRRLVRACETASNKSPPKYDLTIMLGGTNDLAYKLEAGLAGAEEIFNAGLKPLYEQVLDRFESSLIAMTVPERAIDTRSSTLAIKARANREHLNGLIMNWAKEESLQRAKSGAPKVYLFDLARLVPFPKDKDEDDPAPFDEAIWSPDGLHMSASGYDFVGNELATFIKSIL